MASQRLIEKLRKPGHDDITVKLINGNGRVVATRNFTIGHEAYAHAQNWKLLNSDYTYKIIYNNVEG